MRIAFVSDSIYPYFAGGKEKRLYELSTRLASRGHDVHIYTMHWWPSGRTTIREDGVTLHAIAKKRELYKGNKRSVIEGVMFGFACLKLWRVRADVIDVDHMPFFPILGAWVAHFFYRRPLVGTWHEALSHQDWREYMGPLGMVSFVIERLSVTLPKHIVAASRHTQKNLAKFHHRDRGVEVVGSGIDVAALAAIEPDEKPCDILYAGRLVKDKKIDVLLDAFVLVANLKPEARFVIVGDGIERENLEAKVRELNLSERVLFAGRLPHEADVYRYMKKARVFATASIREGFGIVTIESIACGTPVVVTNAEANAAKDLIEDGVTGSVVTPTAEAFADAFMHWLSVEPDQKRMQETASAYDWNILADNLEHHYQSWSRVT